MSARLPLLQRRTVAVVAFLKPRSLAGGRRLVALHLPRGWRLIILQGVIAMVEGVVAMVGWREGRVGYQVRHQAG